MSKPKTGTDTHERIEFATGQLEKHVLLSSKKPTIHDKERSVFRCAQKNTVVVSFFELPDMPCLYFTIILHACK